jgi:peptidyl-tRNA hydrolase
MLSVRCVEVQRMFLDCFHTFRRRMIMPLYMDIHHKVEGLTADAVMHAHEADVKTQEKYDVQYLKYWFDEGSGKVFCLVQAPNKEAAAAVHREAHGLEADEIIEVQEGD